VIEVTCQTCGEKASVSGFLAAAQQPCGHCGQLLMGPLARGARTARPAGFGDLPAPQPPAYGPGSSAGLWVGAFLGVVAGLGVVVGVAALGPAVTPTLRGTILGALMGVLLAPVLAVASFLLMLVSPFSLGGVFGDGMWSRLARSLNERRIRHLLVPFLGLVVLPMVLCGLGGSKVKATNTPMLITAGLGAMLLGAILGTVFGALAGRARPSEQ
jgi:hypothetical protein